MGLPLHLRPARYCFLPLSLRPCIERVEGEAQPSTKRRRGDWRSETRSTARLLPQPLAPASLCACAALPTATRPPTASAGEGPRGRARRGKPKAAAPWRPQAEAGVGEVQERKPGARSLRAAAGFPGHHISLPQGNRGSRNRQPSRPRGANRLPEGGSIRLPGDANGASQGTRGSVRAETHR